MAQLVYRYIQQNDLAKLRKFANANEDAVKNLKDQQGRTPLHWAAQLGNLEAVSELKSRGLPCSAADNQGNLPIHMAAQQGSVEVITELLQGKAKISVKKKNKTGHTPLHYAAQQGHLAAVICLREAGATNDVKDGEGLLPSHSVPVTCPQRQELIAVLTSMDASAASGRAITPAESSPSSIPSPTPALMSEASAGLLTRTSGSGMMSHGGVRMSFNGLQLSRSVGPLPTGIPRRPSETQPPVTPPHAAAGSTPSSNGYGNATVDGAAKLRSSKAQGVDSPTFTGWQGEDKPIPKPAGGTATSPVSIGSVVSATKAGAANGAEPLSKLVKPQQAATKQRAAPSPRLNTASPRPSPGYAVARISTPANGTAQDSQAVKALSPPTFSLSPAVPNTAGHKVTSTPRSSTTHLHQEAAVLELKSMIEQLTGRLETVEQKLKASEEGCRASEEGRREMEELALQTQHALSEQAERLEAAEARVEAAEQQCADAQAALQQAQIILEQAGTHAQETQMLTGQQRAKQDMALRDLTLSVHQLQTDVLGLTRVHNQHEATTSSQIEQLKQQVSRNQLEAATAQAAVQAHVQALTTVRPGRSAPSAPSALTSQPQLFSELPTQQAMSLEQVDARVAELGAALQVLGSRTVGQADLDSLRTRLTKLEALGVSDQIQMLQLRAQQLSSTLSELNSKHLEAEEKLGALQRWQAEQVQLTATQSGHALLLGNSSLKQPKASAGGQSERSTSGSGMDTTSLQQLQNQVVALDSALKDTQTQVAALKEQVTQLQSAPPPAPPTPTHSQSPHPVTPTTNPRRTPGLIGAAAGVETLEQLQKGLSEVTHDAAELKAGVAELRAEVHVTTGNLRREWADAVAEAGRRHAEQHAELATREAKLKSMKDSMFAESDSRQLVQALDSRLGVALKDVDTRLGLLQHKVEVVEEQVQAVVQGETA